MPRVFSCVSIVALASALASGAQAQTQPVTGSPAPAETGSAPTAQETGEIVVTGSRIARQDYTAESPIVSMGQSAIKNNGTPALDQALNSLPQFTGSASAQSPTATTGQARSAGRATANLRGLGAPRTLVLLDGRRLQPSDPFNVIDLNTIPSALIQNVEVITGGASAVYGSDAVAGVVNFRLNPKFSGFQIDADNTVTPRGDGRTSSIAGTMGHNFAEGRGNVVASVQYFNRAEIFRSSRRFFDVVNGASQGSAGLIVASGTNLVSNAALASLFRTKYGLSAQPTNSATISVNPDGSLYGNIGALNFKPQSEYFINRANNTVQYVRDLTLQSPLERISGILKSNYKITDDIEVFAQGLFTNYKTSQSSVGVNSSDPQTLVPVTNPYVPADLRTLLASRPNPNAPFQYASNTARISPLRFSQENTIYQVLGGVRGPLGVSDWKYEAYASHGHTKAVQTSIGYGSRTAFSNLVFAPDGGNSICAGGYPLFTTAPISQACQDYLSRPTRGTETFQQDEAEINLDGKILDLPAGALRASVGADYRQNKFATDPDPQFAADQLLGNVVVLPARGKQRVYEFFGEVFVPILEDVPFFKSLSADLAYRYSHYDTSGGVKTFKASGEWKIIPAIMLRGGYQRAIRAPSVGELFSSLRAGSSTIGTPAQGSGDPCDVRSAYRTGANGSQVRSLCIAQGMPVGIVDTYQTNGTVVASRQTGNPGLSPEIADSFTGGVVLRPRLAVPALSNISLSVDYYKIKVREAIGTVPGSVSLQTCFNGTGENGSYSPSNPFCGNIVRQPGGSIDYLVESVANLARYETAGIDAELDWTVRASDLGLNSDLGSIATNLVVSYVDRYKIQAVSTGAFLNYAGTIGNNTIDVESLAHPKWRITANAAYENGPFQIALRYRYIDHMRNSTTVGSALVAAGVKSVGYFDLNARIRLPGPYEFRFGMLNVGDKQPPIWTGQAATDPATYDLVGRRVFVGVTAHF